ncbi:MAG: hypothetical protein IIC67_09565 [Thaumarchaeota archaeon]|nr:hypothetical protein [Nitrososphaerota archaeon]
MTTIHCPCCHVEVKFNTKAKKQECPNGCCPVDKFYHVQEYEERILKQL